MSEKRKTVSSPLKLGLDGKRIRLSPSSPPKLGEKAIKSLPEELIRVEILPRLPIKSVVRFKSVCKSWLSLFSDPRYVERHYNLQNPEEDNDCLVVDKSTHIVILSRYQDRFVLPNYCYCLIGSARGLVCLQRDHIFSLWNPAIHQSKEFRLPALDYNCLSRVGLGYDPVSNDYRVGICYRSFDKPRLCYAVYSSNSASWTHHQFDDPADDMIRISEFKDSLTPTTMVKDAPYWTTCSTTLSLSNKDKVVLSLGALKFDATNNKFKLLPHFSSEFSKDKTFKVISMRDRLSFMAYEQCPVRKLEVYSLDEDKGCGGGVWSKMYSFGPFEEYRRFRYLLQGFKYGNEIVINEDSKIYRFDYKMGTFDCIPGVKTGLMCVCFTYTPSLVSLPGMTSIYLKNQTPLLGQHPTIPLRLVDSLRDHLPF